MADPLSASRQILFKIVFLFTYYNYIILYVIKLFISLIVISELCGPSLLRANECSSTTPLIITTPREGTKTLNDGVAVRGFLCDNHPFVMVQNLTTQQSILTDTNEVCDHEGCIYPFMTFIDDLVVGSNDIVAQIPTENSDEDGIETIHVEVVRTALACLEGNWAAE